VVVITTATIVVFEAAAISEAVVDKMRTANLVIHGHLRDKNSRTSTWTGFKRAEIDMKSLVESM
jgi:hypothetical protein